LKIGSEKTCQAIRGDSIGGRLGGRRRDWTDEEKRKGLDKFRNGQPPAPKSSVKWPEEKEHAVWCDKRINPEDPCICRRDMQNEMLATCKKAYAEGEPVDVERIDIDKMLQKAFKEWNETRGSFWSICSRTISIKAGAIISSTFFIDKTLSGPSRTFLPQDLYWHIKKVISDEINKP